jgi:hypothetical protein
MWGEVRSLLKDWGVGIDTQIYTRIVSVLGKRGPMKRWQIQAACSNRKWSTSDFTRTFDNAVKNGVVVDPQPGWWELNGEMGK